MIKRILVCEGKGCRRQQGIQEDFGWTIFGFAKLPDGWRNVLGKDICPDCVEKVKELLGFEKENQNE